MKKLFFFSVLLLSASLTVFAQTEERATGTTTKSGQQILPQTGDFGLSIDAAPMLNYLGGFLSNAGADGSDLFQNFGISGQYFLSNDRSIRASLNMGFSSLINKTYEPKAETTTNEEVENSTTTSSSDFLLGLGYVFHRGYGRLQAFYGPEVLLGFGGSGTTSKYGNALSSTYTNGRVPRLLDHKYGSTFTFGVGGFVGVEYFFAPKMSIGGEFGLSLRYASIGDGKTKFESWDGSKVVTEENKTARGSQFNFGTVTTRGSLNVTFYF
ncbi:MAG: hypothetical protein FWD60_10845 [Candidatus Azobacteroides sp.]|nr:hypothetical protein [Candidatus Azobacteroides sp.]